MKWQELTTPEAVLAAFEAGRRVEEYWNDEAGWLALGGARTTGQIAHMQNGGARYRALIEEPTIPEGYTPWAGGECPEDAQGRPTRVAFQEGSVSSSAPKGQAWDWQHRGHNDDIIAYRVESAQPKPEPESAPVGSDIYAAYHTWPDDIRAKLSLHDLRRMSGWAPQPNPEGWAIDTSAGRPILTLNGCSVIEAEDARYLMRLIRKDQQPEPTSSDVEALAWMHHDVGRSGLIPQADDALVERVARSIARAGVNPPDRSWIRIILNAGCEVACRLRPQVTDAMVERALRAQGWEIWREAAEEEMRKALTAALCPEADNE